jgi:AcrR family transcriptional regulator
MTANTKPAGAYHHGDLPRALVAAALELLSTHGPAGLTLRGAARKAGVSEAAPYRHFADKEALLATVAEQGFLALTSEVRASTDGIEDPLQAFRAHGLAYVRFALDHPHHYRVMFGPEVHDKQAFPHLFEAAMLSYEGLFNGITACQEAGEILHADVEELSVAAWSVVHGLSSLVIDRQIPDMSTEGDGRERAVEMAGRILDLLLTGIGLPPAIEKANERKP